MLEFPHADRVANPAALLAHARAAHEPHIGPVFRDTWLPLRIALDALVLAAVAAASLITGLGGGVRPAPGLALAALTFAFLTGGELSTSRLRIVAGEQVRGALIAAALVTMAVAAVELLVDGRGAGLQATVEQGLLSAGALAVAREGMARAESSARRHGLAARRALIIGAGQVGRLTAERLLENPELGLRPIGFLDKEPLDTVVRGVALPVFGASWDLEQVVADQQVEVVIVAFSTAPTHVPLSIVRRCWELGVGVVLIPRLFEVMGTRAVTDHIGGLPLITLNPANPHGWQLKVKYALDRLFGALAILVLAPVLGAIALAVRLTMGGPVLFRQPRLGRDGRVFDMLKFRTMWGDPTAQGERDAAWAAEMLSPANANANANANGNGHVKGHVNGHGHNGNGAAPGPDRRTPLGRFLRRYSLDELPQFLNVVRGDMSLVGPRPERAHYADEFQRHVYRYRDRARIKPGLTGWAQVHGLRGETSLADRVEWDNFYIENWSPRLDARILAMTVAHVLREPQS
jgi:exopolysaccharide biosynthesis polyprenyl glycosylphosphotransferase